MDEKDLRNVIIKAMSQLKPKHRKVLTMRCYEDMEWKDIAEVMGMGEIGTKYLYYRAKKKMIKLLAKQGWDGSLLK